MNEIIILNSLVSQYIKERNVQPKISKKLNIDIGDVFWFDKKKKLYYYYGNVDEIIKTKEFQEWQDKRFNKKEVE